MKISTPLIQPLKTFKPENDSQARQFILGWCMRCSHSSTDANYNIRYASCPILQAAHLNDDTSPHYPKEWVLDENNMPVCTGFDVPRPASTVSIKGLVTASMIQQAGGAA